MRPSRRLLLGATLGAAGAALAACSEQSGPTAATSPSDRTTGTSTPSGPTASDPAARTTPTPSATTTASAADVIARASVPVLCYHQVRDWSGDDTAYDKSVLICPPKNFAVHLDAIQAAGFATISPEQYDAHLGGGAPLPAKPVMLTLDDGKDNQVGQALPALTQRDMMATFFIMTVILGNKGWMQRDDVKRIADAGMTIGSHTWDHHMVTTYTTKKDYRTQLDEPAALLRKLSGQPVTDFAYPYGAWKARVLPHLLEAGYTAAYQLDEQPVDRVYPQLTLRRMLAVSSWTGPQVVAALDAFTG